MLFAEIPGQEPTKARLLKSLREKRISHAQLFLGETGAGSLALVLAYAQYVNCHNPTENDSCGECQSCRKTKALEHPDVYYTYPVIPFKSGTPPKSLDYFKEWKMALQANPFMEYNDWMNYIEAENKQGNITADECREIIKHLSLMPVYEGYKIQIIWLPERLGKEGNILLKILEEPTANTLFLLVCEKEEMLLPTIISRTQLMRIPKLEDDDIEETLMTKFGIEKTLAQNATKLSDGNLNKALKICKDGDKNYSQDFIDWMRLCWSADYGGLMKWGEEIAKAGRENQKNFFIYGIRLMRECLLMNKNLNSLNRLLPQEKDFAIKFSPFIGEHNITQITELMTNGHYYIERNAQAKLLFFNISLWMNEELRKKQPSLL